MLLRRRLSGLMLPLKFGTNMWNGWGSRSAVLHRLHLPTD